MSEKPVPKWFVTEYKLKGGAKNLLHKDALAIVAYRNALQGDDKWAKLIMGYSDGLPRQDIVLSDDQYNFTMPKGKSGTAKKKAK